jgi:hypothetical protein
LVAQGAAVAQRAAFTHPAERAAMITLRFHAGELIMFDKIKNLGGQITSLAGDAVDGVSATVKGGADAIAQTASGAVHSVSKAAGDLQDKVSDAATRQAISQMRDVMAIAIDELRQRPIHAGPITLTAKVDVMIAALEIQIVIDPEPPRQLPPPAPLDAPDAPDAA